MTETLRFILGDQLSRHIAALEGVDRDNDVVLIAEVADETTYVRHHRRKIAFLFSAMRHFARDLETDGYTVRYVRLEDGETSLSDVLQKAVKDLSPKTVVVTEPGEYRVLEMMRDWQETLDCDVEIRSDTRFFASQEFFLDWARKKDGDMPKSLRMEFFYREMRKGTGYLMDGDGPAGGEWNLDKQNRESLPASIEEPERPNFKVDDITQEVLDLVEDRFGEHGGSLENFEYPVSRAQAIHYLKWFVETALPKFGTYQDAMRQGAPLLFHSNLSALINCGLLGPREVCDRAEEAWQNGDVPLNAAEGFIRQIIGWREFIRGIYWLRMPDYGKENFFKANRSLPEFFWTGETDMNCLKQSIDETWENAYAHHIQRLMVIGNFCLLAGLDPKEVQEWYLIVYHDAYEWVEMPNVVGMILFADGGLFASKPYAASGSYINRMSDYCKHCAYSVSLKTGEGACPFNYLYWDFLMRNAEALRDNHRMQLIMKSMDRMDATKKRTMRSDADKFLQSL
ncbi:cryptochrome/photolyase family protein [Pararhizobium mangrovi]|uniref:Cryptochrome/photolyase family protein n=1 Tax=Pararhizobium mangrovi TaxID=2590452 RepID=A0A506TZF8_9HYPH|nr:cryptochrome/photolyase family protein [Pararhizobium mangrovi]TPW26371.1 cryptochrome/photolyase family protein [Pararhizobium mangrovi]